MTADNFDQLKDFCSSYFHEDWVLDAEDSDQAVSSFLSVGWSADELRKLSEQILRFADRYSNDAALEQGLLSELGCYYLPSADNTSAREWLQHVAATLLEAAGPAR